MPSGAPKQEIIVDDQKLFWDIKPVFESPNGAYSTYDWDGWLYAIQYNGTVGTKGASAPGTFSLTWNDIAHDADDRKITMKLTGSNLHGYENVENPTILGIYENGTISARTHGQNRHFMYTWFDIQWDFYYSDTKETAPGQWAIEFNDLDTSEIYVADNNTPWHETVQLIENFGDIHIIPDTMYIEGSGHPDTPGCWLNFYKTATGKISIQANPKLLYDENTLHTGFMTSVTSGFKMSWWGSAGCATIINQMYGQSNIIADASDGGSITNKGTTQVAWKNDKTYTITADKYYNISKIVINDGTPDTEEIGISDSQTQEYTFTEVMSDQTIKAYFERRKHVLSYDANNDAATGMTVPTTADAGTNVTVSDNGYSVIGYRFAGWNTDRNGSGSSYDPLSRDEIFIDDEDATLYALWEANDYKIAYSPNGADGTMFEQPAKYDEQGAISENVYEREGYEFIGWNTKPDGSGKNYSEGEVFSNLTSEQGGIITLYAQWEFYVRMPKTGVSGEASIALSGAMMILAALAMMRYRATKR